MRSPFLSGQHARVRLRRKAPLPFIALAIGLLASYLPGLFPGGVGVQLSYLGWMVPLLGCGVVALRQLILRRVNIFPLRLWMPWILWVVAYLPFADADNALQRSVMLLTPLVVGAGFSTLQIEEPLIEKFRLWLNRFFWIFIAVAGVTTGLLVAGQLYGVSAFSAGAITASLLVPFGMPHERYAGGDFFVLLGYWIGHAMAARYRYWPIPARAWWRWALSRLDVPLTLAPFIAASKKKRLISAVAWLMAAGVSGFLERWSESRARCPLPFGLRARLSDAVTGVLDLLFR